MIQVVGNFSNDLSGLFRVGGIDTSLHAAVAPATHGSAAPSLPLERKADPRAMPPASVALALIPLLVLLVLALRRESGFRDWCLVSFEDFLGMFGFIGRRRHVIHDKPYLDRMLEAEFGDHHPPSDLMPASSRPSSEEPLAKDHILPSTPYAGRDLPS